MGKEKKKMFLVEVDAAKVEDIKKTLSGFDATITDINKDDIFESYLAADKDGTIGIYQQPPRRNGDRQWLAETYENFYMLEGKVDKRLSWEDEPLPVKIIILN